MSVFAPIPPSLGYCSVKKMMMTEMATPESKPADRISYRVDDGGQRSIPHAHTQTGAGKREDKETHSCTWSTTRSDGGG